MICRALSHSCCGCCAERVVNRAVMPMAAPPGIQPVMCTRHMQFLHDFCFKEIDSRRAHSARHHLSRCHCALHPAPPRLRPATRMLRPGRAQGPPRGPLRSHLRRRGSEPVEPWAGGHRFPNTNGARRLSYALLPRPLKKNTSPLRIALALTAEARPHPIPPARPLGCPSPPRSSRRSRPPTRTASRGCSSSTRRTSSASSSRSAPRSSPRSS